MRSTQLLALASAASLARAAETILGVYVLSRHGDRTDKSHPPTKLTELGYSQVLQSGDYYRSRYLDNSSSTYISGIAPNVVTQSQIYISASDDNVLMNSAQGFLQGLYPPVGDSASTETLRNTTVVRGIMGGYQLIPVHTTDNSAPASEDAAWLQGTSACVNAVASSKKYTQSMEYKNMLNSTMNFYQGLQGVINGTFNTSQTSFANAYTIFDLINVAEIHNATINSSSLLTNETLTQIRTLADTHEFNSAYNASEPVRAIAGSTFAAEVISHLNSTITSSGKTKLGVQFAAYATFQAFFGLAQLPAASSDFYGVPDYASSMSFELYTEASATPFPSADDLMVRFLFHNGSTAAGGELAAYPLFGQSSSSVSWTTFLDEMNKFAVTSDAEWCDVCGASSGTCSATATTSSSSSGSGSASSTASSGGSGGISKAVAGVIGAVVALAVVLLVEGLIMVLFGLTLVKKHNKTPSISGSSNPSIEK